ncbi:hypothetical protein DM860_000935 [Cuscuta australis]|uniref:Uncharacterized protein n=1 Tax=Cuscuta australis TaxID=267555 RepID=A0A328DSF0_9ASTE|nr:hypothetical protein DM860_000935 [Cuscuta australis]
MREAERRTGLSAVSEDALNHGGDFIFSNRPKRLESLGSEELEIAELSDLHVVRAVIGPDQIRAVPAQIRGGSGPEPVRQALIVLLQHLLRELRRGDDDVELGSEVEGEYGPELLGPLREVTEPHRLYVVQVSDDREGTRARRELESEPVVEFVGGEEEEYGEEEEERERHGGGGPVIEA